MCPQYVLLLCVYILIISSSLLAFVVLCHNSKEEIKTTEKIKTENTQLKAELDEANRNMASLKMELLPKLKAAEGRTNAVTAELKQAAVDKKVCLIACIFRNIS